MEKEQSKTLTRKLDLEIALGTRVSHNIRISGYSLLPSRKNTSSRPEGGSQHWLLKGYYSTQWDWFSYSSIPGENLGDKKVKEKKDLALLLPETKGIGNVFSSLLDSVARN